MLKVEGPGLSFQVSGVSFLILTDVRLGQIKPKTRNSASGAGRSGVAGSVHPRLHNLPRKRRLSLKCMGLLAFG